MTKGAAPGHVCLSAAPPDTVTNEDARHVTPFARRQKHFSFLRFGHENVSNVPEVSPTPVTHRSRWERWKHDVLLCSWVDQDVLYIL